MLHDLRLTPEQAVKAVTIIARLRRALDAERRFDQAVERSLHRILGPILKEELARAAQAGGRPCL
jgi:hypothetical protein